MFSLKNAFFLVALFPMILAGCAGSLTGCAGSTNALNSTAQIERINFKPDSSPMPDSQSWIDRAENEDPAAIFVLQMMYRDNIGGVDHLLEGKPSENALDKLEMKRERVRWLNRVVDDNVLASFVHSPSLFYEIPDFMEIGETDNEAIAWLEEAAKRGYGNAEYVLGLFHWNGIVVPVDKTKGFELIRRAASHGVSNAQYHLGMIYELGLEQPANPKLASAWLEQAVENGNQDAVFILSMKYLDGIGVPKDKEKYKDIDEKKDRGMHPWPKIRGFSSPFDLTCSFEYDRGTPEGRNEGGCGDEENYEDDITDDMTDEERERYIEEQALTAQVSDTLDYGIDYELASRWLVEAAKGPRNYESQLTLAIVQDADCRFNDALEAPITSSLLTALAEQKYPGSKYMLAEYYRSFYRSLGCSASSLLGESYAQEAFKWYVSAAEDGDKAACSVLSDLYSHDDDECIIEKNDIKLDYEKAYYYAQKGESSIARSVYIADTLASDYLERNDYPNAIKWYQTAIDNSIADNVDNSEVREYYFDLAKKFYFALAKIYDTGPDDLQNKDKAFEYYKQATQGGRFRFIQSDDRVNLIRFGMLYENGTATIKPNKALAIEWYKRGLEACLESYCEVMPSKNVQSKDDVIELNPHNETGKLVLKAQKALLALPSFDLVNAVVEQIKLESDKDPAEDSVIQSALVPCLKSDRGEDEVCPMNDPLYAEAIRMTVTGITALSLAKTGKTDKNVILNTYYNLAILYGMNRNFKNLLRDISPVYKKIHDDSYYDLSYRERYKLFNIWYLRHIPEAAAEVFKTLGNTEKTWDEYMKEAQKIVENDDKLKTGFGYNLLEEKPQPFTVQP